MHRKGKAKAAFLLLLLLAAMLPGCRASETAAETEETAVLITETTETKTEPAETEKPAAELTEPQWEGDYIKNILIVGQASRGGEEAKLADSMILVTLNPKNNTITLTSFLRDSFVTIPSYAGRLCGGQNRINIIYHLGCRWNGAYGGMEMMDKCLKENFSVQVDHNVEIDFESFQHIIDAIGGIDLILSEQERDYLLEDKTGYNDYVTAGKNHLNGYTALCYARMRKPDSDVQRAQRQRKVISAVLHQSRRLKIHELARLAGTVSQLVMTDMYPGEMTELIAMGIPMLKNLDLRTAQCPAPDTYWWSTIPLDGYMSNVVKFDLQKNREILEKRCELPVSENEE